jgi:AcrR family transcriptional regulator
LDGNQFGSGAVVDAKTKAVRKPRAARKPRSAAPARTARADAAPRGDARRKAILRALHGCVISKGYSKTTLADVAEAAGMYPSHLLYYFEGKEAILEHYFQDVSDKIVSRLQSFSAESPERQIELLANLFFAGEGIKKTEIGFMLECFGVAVNDSVLREEKAGLDRQCKDYLYELFQQSPRRIMQDARDCAEIAYAMLIGLRSAVYFDEKLNLPDAYRLFHSAVQHMAGYATVS